MNAFYYIHQTSQRSALCPVRWCVLSRLVLCWHPAVRGIDPLQTGCSGLRRTNTAVALRVFTRSCKCAHRQRACAQEHAPTQCARLGCAAACSELVRMLPKGLLGNCESWLKSAEFERSKQDGACAWRLSVKLLCCFWGERWSFVERKERKTLPTPFSVFKWLPCVLYWTLL